MMECCGFHRAGAMSRRGLIRTLGLGGAANLAGFVAQPVFAAGHPAKRPAKAASPASAPAPVVAPAVVAAPAHGTDVLLLTCMDFRLQNETVTYMDRRGLRDKYDHIVLAGASLGPQIPDRPDWSRVFWDHLETAIALHHISKVIVLDHLDCGAYKAFLGQTAVATPEQEYVAHARRLRLLRGAINEQNPMLEVELGLMALDGSVRMVT